MPCLFEIIEKNRDKSVWVQLKDAARASAKAYLNSKQRVDTSKLGLRELLEAVSRDGEPVDLSAAHAECSLVRLEPMDAGELRNCLRHVEVLLGMEPLLMALQLEPTQSSPTENSRDNSGAVVADLQEAMTFVLEGYGGVNITHNSKDAAALDSLRRAKAASPSLRTFVGVRALALVKNTGEYAGWKKGNSLTVQHKKEKYVIGAKVVGRWSEGNYVLLEVDDIQRYSD